MIKKQIKNFISNPAFIISLIVLFCIILVVVFYHNTEYKANILTELFSILITIGFIDVIFNYKKRKDQERKNNIEILRLNNLFYIYLMQYKGAYDRIFATEEIIYSDMSKLLKPSPSRINLLYKPAYIDFFRVWTKFFHQAESFISKLDLGENTELVKLLETFIINNMLVEELSVSMQNLEYDNVRNNEINMIEATSETPQIREIPNLHDKYVLIYKLIKGNLEFIKKYEQLIDSYKN